MSMNLAPLLSPRSVALIGATANQSVFRGRLTDGLLDYGYPGNVHLVSPSAGEIRGVPCYASIDEVTDAVDLAILAIPAEHVLGVLEACGRKGVGSALIVSSGFSDEGNDAGRERERGIREIAQRFELPVMGPNSQGFLNASLPLPASFSGVVIDGSDHSLSTNDSAGGAVAMIAQSGGIGFSIYDKGRDLVLPFSSVIAVGNQAVLDVVDFLEHVVADTQTRVIQLFIEGINNPRRFERALAAAARAGKPVVATKIGRSEVGAAASASHTGSLAGSHKAYEAVFKYYGVQVADTAEALLAYTACFSYWSEALPRGKRVAILTPSGGAGIWLSDVCEENGLEVVVLDAQTRARMDAMQPEYASSRNPVDVTAQGLIENGYAKPLELLANSPLVDAVIVACTSSRTQLLEADYEALKTLRSSLGKPVIFCSYTKQNPDFTRLLAKLGYPCLTDMASVAQSVSRMADYRNFRSTLASAINEPDLNTLSDDRTEFGLPANAILCEYRAKQVLSSFGMPLSMGRLSTSEAEAEAAFQAIGGPVVLKIQSPDILHKTDAGGVRLGLSERESVREAYTDIIGKARRHNAEAEIDGVLVEPMADKGVEVIIGINRDDDFGPMLMVGMGGIYVELLEDVVFSPVPVNLEQAEGMLASLRCLALLDGYRGEPAADTAALCRLLVDLSHFAHRHRDVIREVDLNPVLVHPAGAGVTIVDALIVTESRDAG